MRIGLGVTALRRNERVGRRDGIGSYSMALRSEFQRIRSEHCFVDATFDTEAEPYDRQTRRYEMTALSSAAIGRRYSPVQLFSKNFDLFHALDHYIPKMTIPVVATIHDVGPISHPHLWPQKFRFWKNLLFAAKCRFPTSVIAVSKFTADELVKYIGIESARIEVIYEGICQHVVEESRAALDWANIERSYGLVPGYIAYCGSISNKKNVFGLLSAHALMPKGLRTRHPLVLVGGVPEKEDAKEVVEVIRRESLSETVKWLGPLSDGEAAKIVHHSDLFAFPSLHEGFGLPVVEAFQLGVPVLTSNVASLPEISGGCAALVDPCDYGAVSKALEKLLRSHSYRIELSERGRERARSFNWRQCAGATLEVYKNVLA